MPMMNDNVTLTKGPLDVERWNESFMNGIRRWKGVQPQRSGLGDKILSNGELFCEMYTTMRQISMRIKLPRTHQQRALNASMARIPRDKNLANEGWVELTIDSDDTLQDALTLARQAYLETQR